MIVKVRIIMEGRAAATSAAHTQRKHGVEHAHMDAGDELSSTYHIPRIAGRLGGGARGGKRSGQYLPGYKQPAPWRR